MPDFTLEQLGTIRIASPCPMKWENMQGDDRVRHCADCNLNVYNFSDMMPAEILATLEIKANGARLCASFYRRPDGTILTRDCPVGLRLVRQKLRRTAARIAAAVGMLITGSFALAIPGRDAGKMRTYQPFASLCEWLAPTAPPPSVIRFAGDVAYVPPANNTSGAPNRSANVEQDSGH